jgi:hypothetical protein
MNKRRFTRVYIAAALLLFLLLGAATFSAVSPFYLFLFAIFPYAPLCFFVYRAILILGPYPHGVDDPTTAHDRAGRLPYAGAQETTLMPPGVSPSGERATEEYVEQGSDRRRGDVNGL